MDFRVCDKLASNKSGARMKVCLHCKYISPFDDWTSPLCGRQPERLNGLEAHAPEFANGMGW